ncbi:hypothetical protein O181_116868, partial [Austropuccinia psidii MF-1]|nr:hypothetical protein [Austropuccinia psidii MF-1]
GNSKLSQVVEIFTLNEEIIEKPNQILSRLQEYANHCQAKDTQPTEYVPASALCVTHKKEYFFVKNPHLRPQKQDNNRKSPNSNPAAHILTAQALHTNADSRSSPGKLVVDCGATHHIFHSEDSFTSLSKYSTLAVTTGDSSSNLMAEGVGTVNLLSKNQVLMLPNTLFVPKLNCNLVSLLKLFDKKLTFNRDSDSFILTAKGKEIIQGKTENNPMKVNYHLPTVYKMIVIANPWHERLGHAGSSVIKSMGLPLSEDSCIICDLNKIHCLPFKGHFEPADLPLDCVHIDLVGPILSPSISGCCYFGTIVDQATSYKVILILKNKLDSFGQFTIAKKKMETQQDRLLKRLISDQGGEFLNSHFKQLLDECRFIHTFSPAYTPEHNGFAKRANQTILEKARCMLNASKLPKSYWAKAVSTATLLSNYTPTPSRHNHSHYAMWTKLSPRIKKLRVFGCQAFVMTPKEHQQRKLGPTEEEGIFLGYKNDSAYCILFLLETKVVISKHARFNETVFPDLKQQEVDIAPLNIPWDAVEGQEVVDEPHSPPEFPLEPDYQELQGGFIQHSQNTVSYRQDSNTGFTKYRCK